MSSSLSTQPRYARRDRIAQLDPVADYREIVGLFYADFASAVTFQGAEGLMISFSAPRISRILERTGAFERDFAKRVVDQALLVGEMLRTGFEPGSGRTALRTMNGMHRHYDIHHDDFAVIGADTVVIPVLLAERYGWRPVTPAEKAALGQAAFQMVRRMGVHDYPESFYDQVALRDRYIDEHCGFEPQNRKLTDLLIRFYADQLPRPLRPFVGPFFRSIFDPRIVRACGYEVPRGAAALRAAMTLIGRRDPIPDGRPNGLAALAAQVYPNGFQLHALGTHVHGDEADAAETSTRDDTPGLPAAAAER
jgi:hypothetical protein